jgi:hypothetical protein
MFARLLVMAAVLVTAATAEAAFTVVDPPFKSQLGQGQILEQIYGAQFARAGRNFTAGGIAAIRLKDAPFGRAQGMGERDPVGVDQLWQGGLYTATVRARYAPQGGDLSFGYQGATGGAYHKLFDVTGFGLDAQGSSGLVDGRSLTWRWVESRGGSDTFSSLRTDNGGKDYLVAYRVTGLADEKSWTTWVLFWENGFKNNRSCDYNDLVVEVKAATMPLPGAMLLGMIGLCLVGCYQRRQIQLPPPPAP